MQMNERELSKFIKRRDKALIECFRNGDYQLFYSYLKYYYDKEEVEKFKKIHNYAKKKQICKMICHIDTIPEHIRKEAEAWLKNGKKKIGVK